ncbi:MAG TPA: secretin and TonB N-terminal domain-containing protein [Tepidisphaeraceae bacterium]|nr:secretin and TonB N-terminal domain-containing protein [Tepidisphaeraceae bacterium]
MVKMSKTAGLLFMAAASVYYGQGVLAAPGKSGAGPAGGGKTPATDVRLLEDLSPGAPAPATQAATAPAAAGAKPDAVVDPKDAAPAKAEGRSVSKSEVAVSDEGEVEIHVNDASLVEVLRMLSLQSQKNILCSKDVRGTVTANLYKVTIREALDQILHMNGYAYREKGNFINVYTVKELQAIEEAERKTTTEVFRLHYTPAANALNMVKPVMSQIGQVSATTPAQSGIAAGGTDVGGGSHATQDMLVVTDYPDNLDRVRKVLKDVDRRPQQVLVEATILRAALTEDNALGVDFNVLAGVKLNQFTSTNGQITNAGLTSGTTADLTKGIGSVGTGNSFSSSVPGGFKVGFVSDNVSVFLSALEGVTDTTVLANPKILALNKQKGEVIVGRKDGYLTTTVTESSTVQTVEFLDTGTKLIFRPFIGDDGYVRMEIHPEDSSGGLTGANLPFKITTEMTSNIMVKDGHTIVIGGLFRESSDTGRNQVPGLGNIPLAGALFRQQRDRTNREEIIILLTPHVIKDDSAYASVSEDELRKAERLRVGVRKGMMPWGRERLAEASYQSAMADLKAGNNQRALWHLDCATNLNPKFIEAIELKQSVTGREISTVDGSSIRGFVRRAMLADKGVIVTPPPPVTPGAGAPEKKDANKPGQSAASASEQSAAPDASKRESSGPESVAQGEPGEPEQLDLPDDAQPEADQVVAGTPAPSEKKGDAKADAKVESAKAEEKPAATKPEDAKPKSEPQVTVTELPLDEVKPDAPSADGNK